jgi:hypothetical protein
MYGSAEDFVTYHENRGRSIPGTWDDDYIEAALLVASEYLDGRFGAVWIGTPTGGFEQERQWPRTDAYIEDEDYTFADDVVPDRVEKATYEAAYREATTPGSLTVDFKPNKYTSVSVDGAVSVDFNTALWHSADIQIDIPMVKILLKPLIDPEKTGSVSVFSSKGERV